MFKFRNCTYLTESVFILLADLLFKCKSVIDKSGPSADITQDIASQYSLFYILNLVSANFNALGLCQINLSFLLDDELDGATEPEKVEFYRQLDSLKKGTMTDYWN